MKRIVVYVDTLNKSGGRERVISNLIQSWTSKYDVVLITKDNGDSFYPLPNILKKTLSIPVCLSFNPSLVSRYFESVKSFRKAVKTLKKVLSGFEYDYIYVATPQNALECFLAMKQPKTRLIISEHAYAYAFNKIYMLIKRYIYPKAYCISVPNKSDTTVYRKWKANSVYIPHLVSFPVASKNDVSSNIALNVGRLTDDKRQDVLLEMWAMIPNKHDWQLWIVGDGENRNKLEKIIKENHLDESVRLIPATKTIEDIYKNASLFLFTSRWEGFGMVLLESMAFGVPCISFDCPSGPADIIENGINGFLIENGNKKEFVNQVQSFIDFSREKKQALSENAIETVKKWDNERILLEWDAVFK